MSTVTAADEKTSSNNSATESSLDLVMSTINSQEIHLSMPTSRRVITPVIGMLTDTLRGSPVFNVQDIRTGDAKAGAEYFNGAGKCNTCHSPTGDLAGLKSKYETVDIQQRMLFPGGGRGGRRGAPPAASAVRVTVTPQGAAPVSGVRLYMDDFVVSLQDSTGAFHSIKRVPSLKIEKTDPLEAHHALLETITDKNIHDLVAYLETFK